MHSGTHIDAPAHVVEGTPFLDEIPLSAFFGTGVVVSIPKGKWGWSPPRICKRYPRHPAR